ncbi:MAG TPA: hypothetical protein VIQ62_10500 [Burkholderiales bacterium]|jgi:hypothetical protein
MRRHIPYDFDALSGFIASGKPIHALDDTRAAFMKAEDAVAQFQQRSPWRG